MRRRVHAPNRSSGAPAPRAARSGAAGAPASPRDQGVVRELLAKDHHRVSRLWRASEGVVLSQADQRQAIAAFLRRNPGMSFVYEVEGDVVGAVLCGTDGRRGFLHHLAVGAGHRRRGVGRMLVERALAVLSAAGIQKCHLMVLPSNTRAREFWAALGWKERSDVLLMSRMVPGAEAAAGPGAAARDRPVRKASARRR